MPASSTLSSLDCADRIGSESLAPAFFEYFRCSTEAVRFRSREASSNPASVDPAGIPDSLNTALESASSEGSECLLPFDVQEVVNHIRGERYVINQADPVWKRLVRQAYYALRPAFPVAFRRHLQRAWLNGRTKQSFPQWPVDCTVDRFFTGLMRQALKASPEQRIPFIWFWPEGYSGCAIMTHDVETAAGVEFCSRLMDINDSFGIRSSFQLIPNARYTVTPQVLSSIKRRGFEINVHDLKHDGHLYDSRDRFIGAAREINEAARRFDSCGFRSGVLYRNQDWYGEFRFSYDMSVPNAAHFDPQPGGCCTVMPYFIGNILELPVTTTQDYSLFHILQTFSTELWQQQVERIREYYGLISFIVHPDYLNTAPAMGAYRNLLHALAALRDRGELWIPLPGEVDRWWRDRHRMTIAPTGNGWRIEGPGSGRARLAFASLENDRVRYSLAPADYAL